MDIKGLDYNTQREPLMLPEYGREIQNMVDYAITLPTKELRTQCAKTIIRMMATKVPQLTENKDYIQTLWDHLYLMSRKELDIEWPYDVSAAEKIMAKPEPMPVKKDGGIRLRHYGRLVEEMFELLQTMPEGEERDELVRLTANQMKRNLATWGHGSMDDEKVADDLARFTNGVIQLDLNSFKFERIQSYGNDNSRGMQRKKKK